MGWFKEEMVRASWSNRSLASGSSERLEGRIFYGDDALEPCIQRAIHLADATSSER